MQNATYIALSGQMAVQRQMDVIANNLANANTPGFKGEEMLFSQYLVEPRGTNNPLAYVEDAGTVRDLRQGPIAQTGNPLDLAISGQGYFPVQTPLGPRYTRNGHFQLDSQGRIVTTDGYPLIGAGGQPIVAAPGSRGITVAPDGTVSAGQAGSTQQATIGTVQVVDFAVPQAVTPAANGLWVTDQTPQPANATIQQGMIEDSNVQPVVELTRMLAISRESGMVSSFLSEEDQRRSNAIDKISQVS
jgi:flagellar basal-body rod protein FlgF